MRPFNNLLCAFLGHKRGKRIPYAVAPDIRSYVCPRCGATWTRKAPKAKAVA